MGRDRRRRLALILLALLLAGCWDRVELEDQAYIVQLGLDRGQPGQLLVTAQIALVQSAGPGILGPVKPPEPSGAAGCHAMATVAGTVTQALYLLNAGMSRRLDFRHLRNVVIGEGLAREGVEPVIMELSRNPLSRGGPW